MFDDIRQRSAGIVVENSSTQSKDNALRLPSERTVHSCRVKDSELRRVRRVDPCSPFNLRIDVGVSFVPKSSESNDKVHRSYLVIAELGCSTHHAVTLKDNIHCAFGLG